MEPPDQRQFQDDLLSPTFRIGVDKGMWGVPGPEILPDAPAWPAIVFWVAAPRPNAGDRFYISLDVAGYRAASPTGTFWDSTTKSMLAVPLRPRGKVNSRVAKVFRTDWEKGVAFYHPYDRFAQKTHPNWVREQPHLVWTIDHTIVDFLEEIYALLNSEDYIGI